ncbi:hypothetical protein LSH36_199g04005 [Paralvinella palmiformis]|uniref:Uncharacterized protein n=1 Tax=Paralvinella palmiformis TaxID=53620 RepID=A0AAD9N535_9ANNE|nr:hypothetical protein LSH36_199g04005 [Paralvinella palmiformis]
MAGTFSGMGELPDLTVLRNFAREELIDHLESVKGCKDLVLDPDLMKPLDRIAGATLLKEHGVDKIFKLEPPTNVKHLPGCDKRIYITRPRLDAMKYIADHINAEKGQGEKRTYKILMTPRKLQICEKLLEQEGVFGYVDVSSMALDLIPLDKDIISLELPQFITSYFMDGDQTWCHTAAMALNSLQQTFGQIPDVYGIGKCSQPEIKLWPFQDTDFVTPLCSQVTYEGLLQDTFGMECGFVDFPPEVSGRDTSIKMLLTSYDEVYEDIRDRHFSNVFTYLSHTARSLQRQYDKRHNITSVSEMKEFVSKDLKGLKQQHKSLALRLLEGVEIKENINYIEEIIDRQLNQTQCLQLLCLLSLTQGGLSSQVYKSLKTQYLHVLSRQGFSSVEDVLKLITCPHFSKLRAKSAKGYKFIILTTAIVNGHSFIHLCEKG